MPSDLTILILTFNEELNLPNALRSLRVLEANIYIVDSGSTDRTVEIAREAGCTVVYRKFQNYSTQFQFAIDTAPFGSKWLMRMDADETIDETLAGEIQAIIRGEGPSADAFEVRRKLFFWGKWMRFGGLYPTWLLRLWRSGKGRIESQQMDEHIIVAGSIRRLRGHVIDENHKGLSFWTDKHNRYSDREVLDTTGGFSAADQLAGQAQRRRFLKVEIYLRAPPLYRALLLFVLRYFVFLGFLDGRSGLVFHLLQGLWYRFLVDAKLIEARRKVV
jgi:glycosyltransferase involved in cell wall biosynthesis